MGRRGMYVYLSEMVLCHISSDNMVVHLKSLSGNRRGEAHIETRFSDRLQKQAVFGSMIAPQDSYTAYFRLLESPLLFLRDFLEARDKILQPYLLFGPLSFSGDRYTSFLSSVSDATESFP